MNNSHTILILSALTCIPFVGLSQVQVDKPAASGKKFGNVLEANVSSTKSTMVKNNSAVASSSSDVPVDTASLNVIQWDNVPFHTERPSNMKAVLVESPKK